MSRILLPLLIVFSSTAFAEFSATLLSWEQLNALTPQQRMAYMDGYRKLMIMMDNQQVQHKLVAEEYNSDFSEKVAFVMDYFSIVPSAEAEDAGENVVITTPAAPPVKAPVTTSAKGDGRTPITAPDDGSGGFEKPANNGANPLTAPDDGSGGFQRPVTPPPKLGEDSCPEPKKRDCKENPDELKSVKDWRADASEDSNSCIVGGFFSRYENPNPSKARGKCKVIRQFPPESDKPIQKACAKNQALCNPFLFCMIKKDKAGTHPVLRCEPISRPKTNVTERCEAWRNAGKDGTACDPTQLTAPEGVNWANEWKNQKAQFEKNFNKRCFANQGGKASGYEELFCAECNVMSRILYKMNKDAINYGCASKPVANLAPAPSGGFAQPTLKAAPLPPVRNIPPPPQKGDASK